MSSCADVGTLRLYLVAAAFCTPRTYREGHAEQFAPTPLTLVVPRPATIEPGRATTRVKTFETFVTRSTFPHDTLSGPGRAVSLHSKCSKYTLLPGSDCDSVVVRRLRSINALPGPTTDAPRRRPQHKEH